MPVTSGQGNPNWTWDEVLLALELYLHTRPHLPSSSDPKVFELSQLLRRLPVHPIHKRNDSFRNAASVAFKLQNLRVIETGKGLKNSSATDKAVWDYFKGRPEELKLIAERIRTTSQLLDESHSVSDESEDDLEFPEGRVLFRYHTKRERNASLRRQLLDRMRGKLACAGCSTVAPDVSDGARDAIFEVHHIRPLSDAGESNTKLSDVVLLCANCHRLIHRMSSLRKAWYSVNEFREATNKSQ